jgi:hypothetical protein
MTPKEKAKELIDKMYGVRSSAASEITMYFAKQCALIAVDEISYNCYKVMKPFWQEVKQEIENL